MPEAVLGSQGFTILIRIIVAKNVKISYQYQYVCCNKSYCLIVLYPTKEKSEK